MAWHWTCVCAAQNAALFGKCWRCGVSKGAVQGLLGTAAPQKKVSRQAWFAVGGVLLYLFVQNIVSPWNPHQRWWVLTCAQEEILDRLRTPDTARFAPFRECEIVMKGDRATASGWFESQNAFGTPWRHWFVATMRLDGRRWEVTDLDVD